MVSTLICTYPGSLTWEIRLSINISPYYKRIAMLFPDKKINCQVLINFQIDKDYTMY